MPIINRPLCHWLAFCGLAPAFLLDSDPASAAGAEPFPARPIRLISPFAPGGGNDIISRSLGAAVSKGLGQSIVVDNRPGANTIVAMEILARSTPDGHTLLTTSSSQATNATLYTKLPYDSVKDFAPVSRIAVSPLIVAVNPALPIKSVNCTTQSRNHRRARHTGIQGTTDDGRRRSRAQHTGTICCADSIRNRQVGKNNQAIGREA